MSGIIRTMSTPPGEPNGVDQQPPDDIPHINGHAESAETDAELPIWTQTPEVAHQPIIQPPSPDALEELEAFDWQDFEARYEAALAKASEEEKAVLREAESLSKVFILYSTNDCRRITYPFLQYFQTWAAAASSHDNDRAVKRLQTRQRFINMSEEKLAQKQQHCKGYLCLLF